MTSYSEPVAGGSVISSLTEVLARYWGYGGFLPLQREAMQCVAEHRDSVVVLPTGGGKSLCFQAPAMLHDGVAIVVSPLISLMQDQVESLRSCGVPAAYVNSTLSYAEKRDVADRLRRGEVRLLYVAPERLMNEKTLSFLKTLRVSLVAIDEAHCISAWGHDFRPEYRELRILREAFPDVGVHAYTATATPRVRQDIAAQLRLRDPRFLVGSFDRRNLVYKVLRRHSGLRQVRDVLERHRGESGIVFCITRREVEQTCRALVEEGWRALPYHAGLPDEVRKANQQAFMQDRAETIVATIAFGMGIDKPNVRYVVHSGMPKSLENYQQESGRAGRDGLEAECVLIYSGRDYLTWNRIIEDSETPPEGETTSLDAIWEFCTSVTCRHRALVSHFGQQLEGTTCEACDVCLGDLDLVDDPLTIGQKVLSCVVRLNQQYGGDYTAKVLTGSGDAQITARGHAQLSTYGILGTENKRTVRDWIEQLVGQRYLQKDGEYNVLKVTDEGWRLLKGAATPQLLRPVKEAGDRRLSAPFTDSWEGVDRGLFEELRVLRREEAAARKVQPYMVFDDVALRDMARRRPTTPEGLSQVRGVGEKKLHDYGPLFLERITRYCQLKSLSTDVTPPLADAPRTRPASTDSVNMTMRDAFQHFRRGAGPDEVATALARAPSTVHKYLIEFIRHDHITDPTPWVDLETVNRVEQALDEADSSRLQPIFEALGKIVPYETIQIVATCRAVRAAEAGGASDSPG